MQILSQKKVGILGGVSWHSTQIYYQTLQKLYQQKKGKWNKDKDRRRDLKKNNNNIINK